MLFSCTFYFNHRNVVHIAKCTGVYQDLYAVSDLSEMHAYCLYLACLFESAQDAAGL